MNKFSFIPVRDHHADILNQNIQEAQRQELMASHLLSPIEAVLWGRELSAECYTVLDEDRDMIGIAGIIPGTVLSGSASPWLLTTNKAMKYPREIVILTRKAVREWNKDYSYLINFIDARYDRAVKWAKAVGFTVNDPSPYGPMGMPFHKIEMRRQ